MKAIIKLDDVPAYQIGAPVRVYFPDSMMTNGVVEEVELLKEQEAVEPINSYGTFRCGNCRNIVGYNDGCGRGYQNIFCSKCGKAVKWDA